jgi:hypothetical protein
MSAGAPTFVSLYRSVAIAAALSLANSAQATPVWCYGNITNVYVTVAGNVVARGAYAPDYAQVCNLNSDWQRDRDASGEK